MRWNFLIPATTISTPAVSDQPKGGPHMKSFFKMLLAAAVSATAFASVQAQAPAPRVLKFQS
ncbi:MAG: hypothetical protein EBX69_04705, partial [Betaproteobacteria bacterium]|nr:hypothetical protein [Betaproteobacteria bacterium]